MTRLYDPGELQLFLFILFSDVMLQYWQFFERQIFKL